MVQPLVVACPVALRLAEVGLYKVRYPLHSDGGVTPATACHQQFSFW